METSLSRFREMIKEKKLIDSTISILEWENETIVPQNGIEKLSEMVGYLSMKSYDIITSKEFTKLLDKLNKNTKKLDQKTKREVELLIEEKDKLQRIPAAEYKSYTELVAKSQPLWQKAKAAKDFEMFKKNLKKVFDYTIKFAKYQKKDPKNKNKDLYDIMLEDYEKGMDTKRLDVFFDTLKKELVPLLKTVLKKQKAVKAKMPKISKEEQKKLSRQISEYIGFDFQGGAMGESEHPYTTTIDRDDVRFTTKYVEDMPLASLFSTIHESGHGIYEQQIDKKLEDTMLCDGASMGLHESQSRFYENIIGRNYHFWKGLYKKKIKNPIFDLKLDDVYKMANRVERSMIRTESDELTYTLHIIIRYEIERGLISGDIKIDDLPKVWNSKMKEYLGITPKNDAEGVLQDVHWACGLIGYFPSYAIGNVYSAQIAHTMKKKLKLDDILEKGDMSKIKKWLGDNIHKYGLLMESKDIIKKVTGEELNPKYYIQYLKDKFLGIWG